MAENANLGDDECLKAALQSGNVQHYRLKCMECRIREGLKKKNEGNGAREMKVKLHFKKSRSEKGKGELRHSGK